MRIVIAEDLALLREGLIRIFRANDFDVVDAVDNGPSLIRALTTHRPDVAIVDVRLPPTFTDEGCAPRSRYASGSRPCPSWCSRSTSSSCTHGS